MGAAILVALMVAATVACGTPQYAQSPEYKNGQFHNTKEVEVITVADAVKSLCAFSLRTRLMRPRPGLFRCKQ